MFNFPGEFKMFQEFVDERIEGDGATLFVRRAGPQGAPPLVLLHEIVKEKSVEELNAQLVSLVGEDGAQLLVGAFRSRRSISGPELTK